MCLPAAEEVKRLLSPDLPMQLVFLIDAPFKPPCYGIRHDT